MAPENTNDLNISDLRLKVDFKTLTEEAHHQQRN